MRRILLLLVALAIAVGLLAGIFWSGKSGDPTDRSTRRAVATRAMPTTQGETSSENAATEPAAIPAARTAPAVRGEAASAPAAPPAASGEPFWLTPDELVALPPLPDTIRSWAEREVQVRLGQQENQGDAVAVAAAYACASSGQQGYCEHARALIDEAAGTDVTGMKTLALNRNLTGYVVAASLVGYQDAAFAAWLNEVLHARTWTAWTDEWSVYQSAMEEPSNGGCHARAAVTAVALYSGDAALLGEVANRFHDWLGRSAAGWRWDPNESWWQSTDNPQEFRGVNPAGATLLIDGLARNVDGVLPEDMKRSGRPEYPFPIENYVRECQQGMVATAWMLHRAGYPAFEWEQQAVLRSFRWFVDEAVGTYRGDDAGLPYMIHNIYGVDYVSEPARPGKNGLGFYDWTHAGRE